MNALKLLPNVVQSRIDTQVSTRLDEGVANTLWLTMNKARAGQTQNFSVELLNSIRGLLQGIRHDDATPPHDAKKAIQYMVLRSAHPEYFSLGGDLAHFHDCIARRDRAGLYQYARLCLDMMYEWATTLNSNMTTIALVQGRALGGGFEAALSADFLIAEEHSEFGFPEILFGLFPCTGGMSLLARRIGVYQAEKMMTNGRVYSAPELKEIGVIDEVCARGEGDLAVEKFIAAHAKYRTARMMVQNSRHRTAPLDYAELLRVVDDWVETAMELGAQELRVMEMLIRMQAGLRERPELRRAS